MDLILRCLGKPFIQIILDCQKCFDLGLLDLKTLGNFFCQRPGHTDTVGNKSKVRHIQMFNWLKIT
jgi:hypothetical protein